MGSIKRGTETNMIVLSPIYSLITLEMTVPGIPALILLMVTSAISIVYGIVSNPSSGGLNCAGINWFFTKSPKTVRAVATPIVADFPDTTLDLQCMCINKLRSPLLPIRYSFEFSSIPCYWCGILGSGVLLELEGTYHKL